MNDRRRRPEPEPSLLYSEKAERITVGEALQNQPFFWNQHGRLKPSSFTVPRLARIWDAMMRAAEKGKPPTKNWIPAFIQHDSEEQDPILFYLNLLINDALEGRAEGGNNDAELHAETVFNLANKRAVLDALDAAKKRVIHSEFGVPPEQLQDMAMKLVGRALDADIDEEFKSYGEFGMDVWNTIAKSKEDESETAGVGLPCGLRAVEEVWGRLFPGKLYVLAGLSGAGKSALAAQIAEAAGKAAKDRKLGIGYISSQEMTGSDYATRTLAKQMGVPADTLERGAIDWAALESLHKKARDLDKYNLFIDVRSGQTIEELGSRMRKAKIQKGGLAFAIIDHLIIMGAEKGDGFFEAITKNMVGAKNLAKKLAIPIIMLAQLDEKKLMESKSKRPNDNYLFGGANTIRMNADAVAFIHRPEEITRKLEPRLDDVEAHDKWVKRMDREKGMATFFNNKRRGGKGGVSRELRWIGETTHFEDI